jgi:uncharacterized protein (DUF169 family)
MAVKSELDILKKFDFKYAPVGVKFNAGRPEGVAHIAEKKTLCEMIKAAQDGKAFYAEAADHTCDAGAYVLGQTDVDKVYTSGEYGAGLGVYASPKAGSKLYKHIHKIKRGKFNYITLVPLDKLSFEPDLVLITADTTQAEIILRASSYKTGDMWLSKYTPAMGCTWLLVYPYMTGEINHIPTGLGFGMRRRHTFPEGYHLISVPASKLPNLLETLSTMPWVPEPYKENGLEYVRQLRIRLGLEKPDDPR